MRGYERFKAIGCAACHNGVAVGGGAYEIMGLEGPYFADRKLPITDADKGRETFTSSRDDFERFKVPNLRNIELTGPYFHDGSAKTLPDAVRAMARYQTTDHAVSEQDVADITAFLKTLTGTYDGMPLKDVPADAPLRMDAPAP
nr:c-type cytochrome [Brytella acorum]